jgi:hypothetical protein
VFHGDPHVLMAFLRNPTFFFYTVPLNPYVPIVQKCVPYFFPQFSHDFPHDFPYAAISTSTTLPHLNGFLRQHRAMDLHRRELQMRRDVGVLDPRLNTMEPCLMGKTIEKT